MKTVVFLTVVLLFSDYYSEELRQSFFGLEILQSEITLSNDTVVYRDCNLFCRDRIEVVVFVDTALVEDLEMYPKSLRLHLSDSTGKAFSMRTIKHWSDRDGRKQNKPFISNEPSVKVLDRITGEIKITFPTKIEIFTKYSGSSMRYDFKSDTYFFQISFDHPDFEPITSGKGILEIK